MTGTCQASQVAAMMEVLPLIPVFDFFVVKEDASMRRWENELRWMEQEAEKVYLFLE